MSKSLLWGAAPSHLTIVGSYILTPDIFSYLENLEYGKGGEIQLTDTIEKLNYESQVFAYDFEGERYDVGDQLGFVQTTIVYALKNNKIGEDILNYIEAKNKKLLI